MEPKNPAEARNGQDSSMADVRSARRQFSEAAKGHGGTSGTGTIRRSRASSQTSPPTWALQHAPPPALGLQHPPAQQHVLSLSQPLQGAGWLPGCRQSNGINNAWDIRSGYPPNGFVKLMNQPHLSVPPQLLGEIFHFVGLTHNFNPTSSPPPPGFRQCASKENIAVEIDGDEGTEASMAVKKRYWTHDEEVRLANSWLNSSNDPINGNGKKSDTFWREITDKFNENAPSNCRRDTNQLKVHWTRLKSVISDFNGFWSMVKKLHTSGFSDDQLMDEAQKLYEKKHGKPFTLVHWWKKLKDEPKWCASLGKEKNKSRPIDLTNDKNEERPIGREAAKAECKGKRKAEEVMDGIVLLGENVNKIVEVQEARKKEREKVTEAQLEISRMNLKAKMFEAYNSQLLCDTSQMTEEAKASRDKPLQKMEHMLFGNNDEP